MKLVYKPFSIIARTITARLGKSAYRGIWSRIDDGEPPGPKLKEASFGKVLAAVTLEAATMAIAAAIADRASARAFEYLFGVWPGEKLEQDS
jgi:hypothetical protein